MAGLVVPTHRRPPFIYRLARALRWTGIIVLVLLILYIGTVAYSAYEAAHATIESRSLTGVLVANGSIEVSGSFTLSNPGIYPIENLELSVHVANDSGVHLGSVLVGPETIIGGSTGLFPISVAFPISASGAAESLLFKDQYIEVNAWANVTYAYLFPLSVILSETRSWGAPFEGFQASAGTPTFQNGSIVTPVTLSWANHASFVEAGGISFEIESASHQNCGGSSFSVNVPPGHLYNQTEDVTLGTGCNPSGGEILASFSIDGSTTSFPPEPIP
ncbi:MAG TPA: hypothetical protein VEH28_07400 [Thermoplasmata archaeon]|nr:hypothetical protein [Thermoplasmata archaeon]